VRRNVTGVRLLGSFPVEQTWKKRRDENKERVSLMNRVLIFFQTPGRESRNEVVVMDITVKGRVFRSWRFKGRPKKYSSFGTLSLRSPFSLRNHPGLTFETKGTRSGVCVSFSGMQMTSLSVKLWCVWGCFVLPFIFFSECILKKGGEQEITRRE